MVKNVFETWCHCQGCMRRRVWICLWSTCSFWLRWPGSRLRSGVVPTWPGLSEYDLYHMPTWMQKKPIMSIESFVSKRCAYFCKLTLLPARKHIVKLFDSNLTTCLQVDVFDIQALEGSSSLSFEVQSAPSLAVFHCNSCVVVTMEFASDSSNDERSLSASCWKMMVIFCDCGDTFDSSNAGIIRRKFS